jgi:hypothetical protein
MKPISVRNKIIVGVLLLMILSGTMLLAREAGLMSWRMAAAATHANDKDHMPAAKKAVLLEANLKQEDELQACYESYLRLQPQIEEGVVEVHWMLDRRGKVSSMEMVRSDLEDEGFKRCLLEKIKKMTFRAPPKNQPILVAHRFNFHKRSAASVNFKQASGGQDEE